ncbi:MAG: hypothetical protein E6J74_17700 [Deltaproteobacteria bacterium]|nr:MAG: hypothetical protein E6J74_17700 [Deltaproteobacteria bacterium]
MNIVIEMSLPVYDGFMDQCPPSHPEYETLKNGVIVRRSKGNRFERILEIHCSVERAKSLLDLAKQVYPDAVPDIEKAIAAPRDS